MKTDIYKITIFKNKRLHQWFRFVGRVPTKEEVIEVIQDCLGDSLVDDDNREAYFSTQIVSEIGIPTEIGPGTGTTWVLLDIEIGKIRVEREKGWILE